LLRLRSKTRKNGSSSSVVSGRSDVENDPSSGDQNAMVRLPDPKIVMIGRPSAGTRKQTQRHVAGRGNINSFLRGIEIDNRPCLSPWAARDFLASIGHPWRSSSERARANDKTMGFFHRMPRHRALATDRNQWRPPAVFLGCPATCTLLDAKQRRRDFLPERPAEAPQECASILMSSTCLSVLPRDANLAESLPAPSARNYVQKRFGGIVGDRVGTSSILDGIN